MPARERRVDAVPQNDRFPPTTPAPSRNPGVRGPPTPPLSSPGRAGPEYPEMPSPAGPRPMLEAVPSPSFPVGAARNRGGWPLIRGHDSAPPPSTIGRARQVPRAVWATPTPAWSSEKDLSPLARLVALVVQQVMVARPTGPIPDDYPIEDYCDPDDHPSRTVPLIGAALYTYVVANSYRVNLTSQYVEMSVMQFLEATHLHEHHGLGEINRPRCQH